MMTEFTERVICPVCADIPTVKMDVRFIARYTCPQCGNDVAIEDARPRRVVFHAAPQSLALSDEKPGVLDPC